MPPRDWFKHAFAIDSVDDITPNDVQRTVVDRLAHEVVRRHLTTPGLILLEMCAPLNFVSAQALHFFEPLISPIVDTGSYREFARFVEQRGSVSYIRDRIEAVERDYAAREETARETAVREKPL